MINFITIAGLSFALFLPGFLLTLIFFKEYRLLERIMLSIAFSIMISIAIGIILGYNQNVKNITGGISQSNAWRIEIILTLLLLFVAIIINIKKINLKNLTSYFKGMQLPNKKFKQGKEIVKYKKL